MHLGGQGEDFEAFLRTVFGAVSKHDLIYRQQKIYNERYQWPLAASLADVIGEPGGGHASLEPPASGGGVARGRRVGRGRGCWSFRAFRECRSGRCSRAQRPTAKTPRRGIQRGYLCVSSGTVSARRRRRSRQSIKVAPASDAKRLADQEDAYYNLGNALYRAGQQFEKSAPQEAIQKWTEAVKAYDTALQLRADDTDSKYNRDFVKRKIDALRQPPNQGGGGGGGGQRRQWRRSVGKVRAKDSGQPQGQPPPQAGNASRQGQPRRRGNPATRRSHRRRDSPRTRSGPTTAATPRRAAAGSACAPSAGNATTARAGRHHARAEGALRKTLKNRLAIISAAPGQMSEEEARELLDSAKSDEHHSLAVPSGPRDPNDPG